jgi:uncharacterized membrane protein
MTNAQHDNGKQIAVISYITIIGLIVAFVMNSEPKHEFAKFHIRQSLGIGLTGLVGAMVLVLIPILGWIILPFFQIGIVVLWVLGLINAINNKSEPVPLLGKYYAEWFKNL